MTVIECSSCGALLLVHEGETVEQVAREHADTADHITMQGGGFDG